MTVNRDQPVTVNREQQAAGERERPVPADREQQVLDRIDRARRRRPKVLEERITMSHGAGGKATQTLIEGLLAPAFGGIR